MKPEYNPDLTIKIEALAKAWEADRHVKILQKHPSHTYEEITVVYGKQFAKIVKIFINGDSPCKEVEGFVALVDGENKTMGPYKAGQIFYPASWASPAKHARGSVYDKNPLACFSEWGIKTLR